MDTQHRVRVTVRARGGEVAPDDIVTLRAVLLPPSSPAAPGAFDFARYAWFHRLGAVGYVVSAPELVEGGEPGAREALAMIEPLALARPIKMALRAADGRLMATSTRSNYTVDSWLRHDGLDSGLPWPKPSEVSNDGRMRCDSLGCIAVVNGVEEAFVQDERAFAEDCARAQIVIAVVPAFNPCPADVVVDRFDVWWRGAQAVWITSDGIRIAVCLRC